MKQVIAKKGRVLFLAEKICRWIVMVVLLAAAIPKIFNVDDFAAIINAYGLLPDFAVLPFAVFLPIAEIGLAIGLFFKIRTSQYLTIFLLLSFIGILTFAMAQGLDIDCGCFGPEDPEHRAFQGLRIAIVRDAVMIVALVSSLWYEKYQESNNYLLGEK